MEAIPGVSPLGNEPSTVADESPQLPCGHHGTQTVGSIPDANSRARNTASPASVFTPGSFMRDVRAGLATTTADTSGVSWSYSSHVFHMASSTRTSVG